ncbi:hypothetical protein NE237_029856 [Protea cynaroides]|uniref:Uncharacterized protein n=1 Tax=Protea cynaroides TaxID=273540 RepID=A0A9Q0GSY2_9MAGN|nr:hypothetical protein NE237_029856 [Protea cynaroides]
MDLGGKNCGIMTTPAKDKHRSRSKASETENSNPNLLRRSPMQKQAESPVVKSKKSKKKSGLKNSFQIVSPHKIGGNLHKCPCIAYENFRASQEEFFRNKGSVERDPDLDELQNCKITDTKYEQKNPVVQDLETAGVSDDKVMEGNASSPDGLTRSFH